jgi:hypothetical protein
MSPSSGRSKAPTLIDGDADEPLRTRRQISIPRALQEVEPAEIYNLAAQSHVQVSFEAAEDARPDLQKVFAVVGTIGGARYQSAQRRMALIGWQEWLRLPEWRCGVKEYNPIKK